MYGDGRVQHGQGRGWQEMSAEGALGFFGGTAPLVGRQRRLPTPFSLCPLYLCLSVCPSISVSLILSDRHIVEREEEEEGHYFKELTDLIMGPGGCEICRATDRWKSRWQSMLQS